ncbi:MAG: metallophosphoesterase [Sphingomonadaceae bacterium]
MRKKLGWGLLILTLLALICAAIAWRDTMRDPAIREIALVLPGEPGAAPVSIVLLSDIHVSGPDMPPERLARIVAQVNALEPDVIMLAGDVVSDKRSATRHYSSAESVAPLRKLRARLGKVYVPGNHDHWRGLAEIRIELEHAGFTVVQNNAIVLGPLVIGGLDDDFTGHADLPATLAAMDGLPGAPVLLSHSPDPFADLPPGQRLMLAGHTHCGQIAWPWGGTPATMSRYGDRYACGVVRENGNTLVVTAGLGTSVLPFRFLVPPDMWRVELQGE